ncbi:MAG: pyridoxamine 5'-phosphate oxidase family protein [Thermoleophilia bacterium]|nr:pyridoxamine 5'-phosphate oxidase family protein [Thermoleophilia bacterium]
MEAKAKRRPPWNASPGSVSRPPRSPRPAKGDNACAFNFDYRSVLAYGTARLLAGPAERDAALRAIIAKYHPETVTAPLNQGMLEKTKVYSLAIRALTYRQHPEV